MPGGRPSKYSETTLEVAENYINRFLDFGDAIPSQEGLARILGINFATMYRWKADERKP